MKVVLFQNGSIGDFLMAVYVAGELHAAGKAERVCIVVPRLEKFLSGFIGDYPYIQLMEVSRTRPLRLFPLALVAFERITAVLPPTPGTLSTRLKWAGWLITRRPGSRLVGFDDHDPLARRLYSVCLPYDTYVPFVETMHALLVALGVPAPRMRPFLSLTPDENIRERLEITQPYVFFHPRGSSEKRSFDMASAVELVDELLARDPHLMLVMSGSRSEQEWLEGVHAQLKAPDRVRLLAGAHPRELAALILHAEFYIGVDTGITHLACFLGAPTLVVAHKATANWLPFYNPKARVLYRLSEDDAVHEDWEYLNEHRHGRLKPFGNVPTEAVLKAAVQMRP